MSKTSRLGVALLSVATFFAYADLQNAQAQRFKSKSNQSNGNDDKKERDDDDHDDDDEHREGDNDSASNGNSNNNSGSNKQGGKRPSNSNQDGVQQIQQFLQRDRNQRGDQNNNPAGQEPGGQSPFRRPGQGNSQFPNQDQFRNSDQFRNDEFRRRDDHDHDHDDHKSFNLGVWQGNKWQGSKKIDHWMQAYGGVSGKPFSSQWYNDHPKAWKFDKGDNNVWVTGTVPGVYKWLNWGNAPPQYSVGPGNANYDLSRFGQWYPLGVFSLMTGPDDEGTRIVQLAVDRHGHISGNYYDMISDSNYSISGDVRQASQRVTFALNKNKYLTFRTRVYELLQPYGSITVQLPGGDQRWQFVRLEN